jgi:hypothetical protein
MTSFDRREEALEAKFAHDEERAFKARARALRMLGLWAAEKRRETGTAAEDYARSLVDADISATPDAASTNLSLIWPDMASTPAKFVKSETRSWQLRNAPPHDCAPLRASFERYADEGVQSHALLRNYQTRCAASGCGAFSILTRRPPSSIVWGIRCSAA